MNPTGRPEGPARDTKADIHRAAVELFSAKGYEKTSLREIAEQVGITKASLYYHYSSKQELLQAIVGTFFDDLGVVLGSVRGTPWSPQNERALLSAYLDVAIRHRHTGPAILRDMGAVLAAYEDSVEELIEKVQAFHAWLAGPDAPPADRLRVAAATEIIGGVLSSGVTPEEVSDADVHDILMDAIQGVLARREARPAGDALHTEAAAGR